MFYEQLGKYNSKNLKKYFKTEIGRNQIKKSAEKPRSVFKKEYKKINQAIKFCIENKINFIWINENNILNYIDKKDFSDYNIVQYRKMLDGIYGKNKNKIN